MYYYSDLLAWSRGILSLSMKYTYSILSFYRTIDSTIVPEHAQGYYAEVHYFEGPAPRRRFLLVK